MEQQRTEETRGIMQEIHHQAPLTSSELASLWRSNTYYAMIRCVNKHFLNTMDDPDLRPPSEYTRSFLEKRVNRSSEILSMEGQPIPKGFGDEDIDLGAPRLFTDLYYYYYFLTLVELGLPLNGTNLSNSVRADVRDFYTESLTTTTRVYNWLSEIIGLYSICRTHSS